MVETSVKLGSGVSLAQLPSAVILVIKKKNRNNVQFMFLFKVLISWRDWTPFALKFLIITLNLNFYIPYWLL